MVPNTDCVNNDPLNLDKYLLFIWHQYGALELINNLPH